MTMPIEGPIPGQGGVPQPGAVQALTAYDDAADQAKKGLGLAQTNLGEAIKAYNNLGPPPATDIMAPNAGASTYDAQARALEGRIQNAQTAINAALGDVSRTADARAQAYAAAAQKADPANQAVLNAQADKAKTDAAKATADLGEWNSTAPDRKAEVALKLRSDATAADKADLDNQFQRETDPTRKAALQQALSKATSDADAAATDAGLARQLAPLRVQQASANIAQTGAQTGLVGAQTADTQSQADQRGALTPGLVAQQTATTGLTTAQTAETNARTNPLQARIDDITAAFKAGKLDALPDPQQFVRDTIAGAGSGTTPFDIFKQGQSEETARLGQQVTQRDVESRLLGLKAGAFGSAGASAFSTIAQMNKDAPKGYTGGADALMSLLGYYQNALGGQNGFNLPPSIPIPNAPSYLDQYKAPVAATTPTAAASAPPTAAVPSPQQQEANIPPPPAATPSGGSGIAEGSGRGHVITINIGGSGGDQPPPQNGSMQSYASGTPFAPGGPALVGEQGPEVMNVPRGAQILPAYLSGQELAMPEHVHAMYPEASARYVQRQRAGIA